MAKVVHGVMLMLAGISLIIVSIWLLVDTRNPKVHSLKTPRGHSPKIGVAASILLMVCGALCCFVSKTNLRRSLILIGVFVAFGLTVSCFGIAVNDRLSLEKDSERAEMFVDKLRGKGQSFTVDEFFSKIKPQLTVMAVVAGLDIIVEIVSMINAYRWKDSYP